MFDRAERALSTFVAPVAPAAAIAAILTVACRLFGAGAQVAPFAVGAVLVGAVLPPARGRWALVAGGGAVLLIGAARAFAAAAWRAGGTDSLLFASICAAAFVGWGLGAPAVARASGRGWPLVGALATGALLAVDAPAPVAVVGFGALLLVLRGSAGAPEAAPELPPGGRWRIVSATAGVVAGGAVALGALVAWSWGRMRVDPTPVAVLVAVVAGGVAATVPLPRWLRAGGALLLVGATYQAAVTGFAGGEGVAYGGGARGAALLAALLGAATGAGLGAVGAGRLSGVALLAAGLLLPRALDRLPTAWVDVAVRPAATLLGDAGRAEALARVHAEWRALYARVGAGGTNAAWVRDGGLVVELDGVAFDPASRQGAAERFAGVLATCATAGRDRARLPDDPAGLALSAVRGAGFAGIDVAAPDAGLVRALAAEFPDVEKEWLAPGVRLLRVPGVAVARLGPLADAVIEPVRAPWTDGARGFPTPSSLADTRATLAPGGVHVVALSTTALTPAALSGWLRAFVRVYPGASLWVPPAGADTAVLLGPRDPSAIPWERIEACAASPAASSLGLRAALDVAGLLLAGPDALRALADGAVPSGGLPATIVHPGPPPLTQLAIVDPDLDAVLGAGTPMSDVLARHATLDSFLGILRTSAEGEMAETVARARALASAPGGQQALAPLVRPQLDRVRSAMARGRQEGIASRAWEEAETALTSARVLAPDYPETRCVEGDLALARNQLPRAEEAFEACAKGDPTNLAPLDGLATVRRLQQDTVGLEAVLRRARDVRPDVWTTAHNLGFYLYSVRRYDEAERLLREGAAGSERGDSPSPAPHLALAHLYLDTSRPERALAEAVQATRLAPDSPEAAFLRGAARYDLGQLRLAEEEFLAALRLDPTNVRARGGLGLVQARDGAYAAAAESFRAVLAVEPRNQGAADNLRRVEALLQGGDAAGD